MKAKLRILINSEFVIVKYVIFLINFIVFDQLIIYVTIVKFTDFKFVS